MLLVYALLFTVTIIGIAHMDAKGSIGLVSVIYNLVIVKLNTTLLE